MCLRSPRTARCRCCSGTWELIPDLGLLRDRFTVAGQRVRAWLYGLFAMGWRGSNRHWSNYEMAYLILAGIATPLVLSVHHDRVLRLCRLADSRLAHDDLPALFRRRCDLFGLRDGADARAAAAGGVQARGPDHAVPHRQHVQDHPGDRVGWSAYAYMMDSSSRGMARTRMRASPSSTAPSVPTLGPTRQMGDLQRHRPRSFSGSRECAAIPAIVWLSFSLLGVNVAPCGWTRFVIIGTSLARDFLALELGVTIRRRSSRSSRFSALSGVW